MYTLITSATSAEAQKLKKQLGREFILLGDYQELPAFMLKANHMLQLPNPASFAYAHEMLTLCLDREIDTIYPLRNEEISVLKEAELLFAEYGILVNGR